MALLDEYRIVYDQCRYTAARNVKKSIKATLEAIALDLDESDKSDVYGSGKLIEDFENEIAILLGKEAAVFLPSGTMAQPIALRIWSDNAKTPYVAMHSTSHVALHENNSYQILYGLKGITLGQPNDVPSLDDLSSAALDPLAAILLELPMREIGGQLPSWDNLVAQSNFAKDKGIKLHMDGARLWQCPSVYQKSLAEISALFDSVYVSFYKDLGGISGAVLAGDESFIAQARVWQSRVGGNLYALYPYVLAAKKGLAENFPDIPKRVDQSRSLAVMLNASNVVATWPVVPHTNMFRLRIQGNPETIMKNAIKCMKQTDIGLITPPYEIGENYICCEMSIGSAFSELTEAQWADHFEEFFSFLAV